MEQTIRTVSISVTRAMIDVNVMRLSIGVVTLTLMLSELAENLTGQVSIGQLITVGVAKTK